MLQELVLDVSRVQAAGAAPQLANVSSKNLTTIKVANSPAHASAQGKKEKQNQNKLQKLNFK